MAKTFHGKIEYDILENGIIRGHVTLNSDFIDFENAYVQPFLNALLKDKTTHNNIVFATSSYESLGDAFKSDKEITRLRLKKMDLRPRVLKSSEEQSLRTRKKAEVFTPSWLCCRMNNYCDDEWFGKTDVFNHLDGKEWISTSEKIEFPEGRTWGNYIDSRRIEITCGEAPYIVSRYDAATGEPIDIINRIGVLDRKLRVVNENAEDYDKWMKWSLRAFQSVYGYEWQGDSLLIARTNLLMTFLEYYEARWGTLPVDDSFYKAISTIVNVIVWNFWQMDGLKGTVPFKALADEDDMSIQLRLFDEDSIGIEHNNKEEEPKGINCRIFDWRTNCSLTYNELRKGKK